VEHSARSRLATDPSVVVSEAAQGFDEFYAREYRAVASLAYALSGSRWAAEDIAQDAFIAAYRDWARVGSYEQPGAWVRRVAANRSASLFRRRMVEAKGLARIALGQANSLPELSADGVDFWRAVRSLPRRQAQAIALYYLEHLSIAEIAGVLGAAEGTIKKHLHEGRKTLAHRLGDQEDAG